MHFQLAYHFLILLYLDLKKKIAIYVSLLGPVARLPTTTKKEGDQWGNPNISIGSSKNNLFLSHCSRIIKSVPTLPLFFPPPSMPAQKIVKKKKHFCNCCNRGFSKLYNMRVHREIHNKDRIIPYICTVTDCRKAFSRKNDYKRHVSAVHMKERPFHCAICNTSFARKGTLDRHVARKMQCKPAPTSSAIIFLR
jgi:uncharacterized Zn-finger protein